MRLSFAQQNSLSDPQDRDAHIAQSVEHFLGKEEVIGSNPIVSTIYKERVATAGRAGLKNKLQTEELTITSPCRAR